ncbi:transcriptional regulator [candidate division KSB1 bacterium RBG_16_48_16]|nr:MAG: transcriptional regulator [candidate division KSB1 bacterium RBG_16_48_16]
MPEISRFLGIIIAMFFDEHNPPHFHARYGKEKVAIEIDSLRILDGRFPPRALGLVMEWASQHKDELLRNWELARDNQPLQKIEPLK